MTKEQWKIAEELLKCVGNPVRLLCDGHKVAYVRGRVSEMKDALVGFRGFEVSRENILTPDLEEAHRFCRSREAYKWKRSSRQAWAKMNKLHRKEVTRHYGPDFDINQKVKFIDPFWNSFGALKAHLIKHNKEIILIDDPLLTLRPSLEAETRKPADHDLERIEGIGS